VLLDQLVLDLHLVRPGVVFGVSDRRTDDSASPAGPSLGDVPDFTVDPLAFAGPQTTALFYLLGVAAGFLAVVYSRTLLGSLALANRLGRWPVEARAGLIGAAVGVLACFLPHPVCGGQEVTQRMLAGGRTLAPLPLVLLLPWGLACVSYAGGTRAGCSRRCSSWAPSSACSSASAAG
jgi:H+/Cl- antiporter ClcA